MEKLLGSDRGVGRVDHQSQPDCRSEAVNFGTC